MSTEGMSSEANHGSPIAIWHQSYTALDALPRYRSQLVAHHARCGPVGSRLAVHGVPEDAVPSGPGDPVTDRAIRDAIVRAEQLGFDVATLGCFYDPALTEAQAAVRIPVLGVLHECALAASGTGRPFALVTLSRPEADLAERMVSVYGCASDLIASLVLTPEMTETAIDAASPDDQDDILSAFAGACRHAADLGALEVIPAEGVLAAFLAANGVTASSGVTVVDPLATLWRAATVAVHRRRHKQGDPLQSPEANRS